LKRSRSTRPTEGDDHLTSPKALREQARRLLARKAALQKKMQEQMASLTTRATAALEAAEILEAAEEKGRPPSEQRLSLSVGEQTPTYGGEQHGEHQLRERSHSATVNRMLTAEHVLAISKGKKGKPSALVAAAHARQLSLRGLSRELETRLGRPVSVSRLSMAAAGDRPIDEDIAQAVQDLIGFKATRKNWPKGFVP
jgi:hypothetical protein